MRLLLIVSTLNRGGIERQISLMAPALQDRGHNVTIAVFHPGNYYHEHLTDLGIEVVPLQDGVYLSNRNPVQRMARSLKRFIRLWQLASNERFDVVYGFGSNANFLAVSARLVTKTKVVWGIRSSEPYGGRLFALLESLMSNFVDSIISNSQRGRQTFVERGLRADKFVTVPNGVDVDLNKPIQEWRTQTREFFGIENDELLIGTIGRMDANKDRATFLRAAQIVESSNSKVKFLLMGASDDSYLQMLRRLAENLGIADRVIWSGPRGDVEKILNGLDIFVSSSITEGFPNVIAEAMAVGVPCVVTDAGDSVDILGGFGFVVPKSDPDAMAEGIIRALSQIHQIDSQVLRNYIVSEYSVTAMVERTEAVLIGLLD